MRKTAMVVVCLLLATVILVVFTANGMKKPVSGQIPFESKVVYANYSDSEKLASSPLNCSADKESLPI